MTETEVRESLCKVNSELLQELEQSVPVHFQSITDKYYGCVIHKGNTGLPIEVVIFCQEPFSNSKIAHELLHAKAGLLLGDNAIMLCLAKQFQIDWMLNERLCSHILNCVEHVITYPIYQADMGFPSNEYFEPDENEEKPTLLDSIKENGKYNIKKVFQYLYWAFSLRFYPIDNRWKKELKSLKKTDFGLYQVINSFYLKIKDITLQETNHKTIQEAYSSLANEMRDWIGRNIFCRF